MHGERSGIPPEDEVDLALHGIGAKGNVPGQHLVEHRPERVDVGACVGERSVPSSGPK